MHGSAEDLSHALQMLSRTLMDLVSEGDYEHLLLKKYVSQDFQMSMVEGCDPASMLSKTLTGHLDNMKKRATANGRCRLLVRSTCAEISDDHDRATVWLTLRVEGWYDEMVIREGVGRMSWVRVGKHWYLGAASRLSNC
jgi:hypothetical protein